MKVTYTGGWKGYIDVDEGVLVWITASPKYRGTMPISESFLSEGVYTFLVEDIGVSDEFWDWLPDN